MECFCNCGQQNKGTKWGFERCYFWLGSAKINPTPTLFYLPIVAKGLLEAAPSLVGPMQCFIGLAIF